MPDSLADGQPKPLLLLWAAHRRPVRYAGWLGRATVPGDTVSTAPGRAPVKGSDVWPQGRVCSCSSVGSEAFAEDGRATKHAPGSAPVKGSDVGRKAVCAVVAQLVRAPDCGSGGRWFKPTQLYQYSQHLIGNFGQARFAG